MANQIVTPKEDLVKDLVRQMSHINGATVVAVAGNISPQAKSIVNGIESLLPKDFEINSEISMGSDTKPVAQSLPKNSTKDTERTV
jgi:aspartyl/asparaginyl-tRNA synthetase